MSGVSYGPISWERMIRAVEKVRERLMRATAALEAAGIPYAVAGGNAVAAWVSRVDEAAVRNTQDVDILCTPEYAAWAVPFGRRNAPSRFDRCRASRCVVARSFAAGACTAIEGIVRYTGGIIHERAAWNHQNHNGLTLNQRRVEQCALALVPGTDGTLRHTSGYF